MERKLIAAAVSSALALPMAAQAVEFSVSGHINRAIISVDGGANDGDVQHVDANSSPTRFRFTGSEELDNGMTAGVNLEYGLAHGKEYGTSLRQANVYLNTAGGKITVGHGSFAADNSAHAYLGGPSWLGGVTNTCSYTSSGPACPSNDGSRGSALRYDTPSIGPLNLAVSVGDNDYWDVQATIAGSFGDAGYDIRIGHIAEHDVPVDDVLANTRPVLGSDLKLGKELEAGNTVWTGDDASSPLDDTDIGSVGDDTLYYVRTPAMKDVVKVKGDVTTASAAVSFGQGTSAAVAWSQEDTGEQVEYQFVALDHSYGDGSIGVYYKRGEYGEETTAKDADGVSKAGREGSLWGVGIGHELGGGATAYAGYRQISEDGMEDIDLLVAGMRVTFN